MATFHIQGSEFETTPASDEPVLSVNSSPRPYQVEFAQDPSPVAMMDRVLSSFDGPLLMIDEEIDAHYPREGSQECATLRVPATEEFKSVDGAFSVIEFLDRNRASRSSMLVAVGGGIVQDVAAFASCVYKRGVPWTYIPTTLLAQADSCIGAKSGLNYQGAKNLIGVFSAPRHIALHPGFLASLPPEDLLSGLGEIFRLSIIGGNESLELFEALEPEAVNADVGALGRLTRSALSVKRAVIERDEFELDLRRSMNFGHSIGHALEALTGHEVPHGIAVAIGVLVESEISVQQDLLAASDRDRFLRLAGPIVPERVRALLSAVPMTNLLDILYRDKKVEGSVLKLVVPEAVGRIRFVDLPLEPATVPLVERALGNALAGLPSAA